MAHFNFVISQNAKWGHAGFYIDCHRMTVPENIVLQKSTGYSCLYTVVEVTDDSRPLRRARAASTWRFRTTTLIGQFYHNERPH